WRVVRSARDLRRADLKRWYVQKNGREQRNSARRWRRRPASRLAVDITPSLITSTSISPTQSAPRRNQLVVARYVSGCEVSKLIFPISCRFFTGDRTAPRFVTGGPPPSTAPQPVQEIRGNQAVDLGVRQQARRSATLPSDFRLRAARMLYV